MSGREEGGVTFGCLPAHHEGQLTIEQGLVSFREW